MFSNMNLKKISLILFIIMICSFIIAGIIFVQSGNLNDIINGKYDHKIDSTRTLNSDGINMIKVDCTDADINLIPVDSNEIKVHLYGNSGSKKTDNDPKLDATIENGNLNINVKTKIIIGFNFSFMKGITLDVYVPRSYSSDVSIKTSSGNTSVKGFKLNSLNCYLSSGDASIDSTSANNCTLKLSSGNATLQGFSGNLDVNSSSGNVSADFIEFNNDINIHETSGNIKLKLPEKAEFSLNAHTSSGDIRNDFPISTTRNSDSRLVGIVVNDNNKITLSASSGDIEINK